MNDDRDRSTSTGREQSGSDAGAAAGAAVRHGDLRRVGRPDEAQAHSGPATTCGAAACCRMTSSCSASRASRSATRTSARASTRTWLPATSRRISGVPRLAPEARLSTSAATSRSRPPIRRSRSGSKTLDADVQERRQLSVLSRGCALALPAGHLSISATPASPTKRRTLAPRHHREAVRAGPRRRRAR